MSKDKKEMSDEKNQDTLGSLDDVNKKTTKKQLIKEETNEKEIISDLTESLQRLQAEFENYKKRMEREKQELIKYGNADLILELLPILDNFELALKNTHDNERFIKGIQMIFAQFYSILQKEGLKPINVVGHKFNPYNSEVLMRVKSNKDDDIVLEELQKGYVLNDKVLRTSKVKVSEKND